MLPTLTVLFWKLSRTSSSVCNNANTITDLHLYIKNFRYNELQMSYAINCMNDYANTITDLHQYIFFLDAMSYKPKAMTLTI